MTQKFDAPLAQETSQPKKKTRVGVLVAGTAAVAMATGAVAAVAVVDHSGAPTPVAQAPAADRVGKPSPITGAAPAQPKGSAPAGSVEQVSAKVLPSVVKLEVETGQGREEGSGIVLSEDGLILTNNHVVASAARGAGGQGPMAAEASPDGQFPGLPRGLFPGGDQYSPDGPSANNSGRTSGAMRATVTMSDGRTVPFSVVGTDPDDDIAVVKAQNISGLTPITIGSSKDLKVGQNVVAVGSPLGLQGTVTTGIISALDRPVATGDGQSGQQSVMSAIQTDAAINPGNSGGALVDMNGDLIGVNSAIASLGGGQGSQGGGQAGSIGLGFAIPVDQAKRLADELVSTGTVQHASLGVQLSCNDGSGAAVAGVVDGGPAAAAGLPNGAVITKLDNKVIDGPDALVAAVRAQAPGDTVTLTFEDPSGASHTVDVTLGQVQA
ncbi:trypsin-like peptidase domain-containing protein [Mycolicibacterium neworleansense]|nr:trypsin-like peptidase domain-containing protein [Mycolicibacterium neworleansense]MCV7363366.1 trypsin-like peptidase domain-containing protein [Mycolicibacterium neworleansense]